MILKMENILSNFIVWSAIITLQQLLFYSFSVIPNYYFINIWDKWKFVTCSEDYKLR